MTIIYFGGSIAATSSNRPPAYTASTKLEALDEEEFRVAFHEWVSQCWLHDSLVPNDAASLNNFDLNKLIPEFRKAFAKGDWKRMIAGRGITAEEYLLFLQLINKQQLALVINLEQPQQPLDRVRNKILLSEAQIGGCLSIALGDPQLRTKLRLESGVPLMLYDGKIGHVITARAIDDGRDWIFFDDPTWPGNKSMLCQGENAAGTDAQYFGDDEVGEWAVNIIHLGRVLFALPITQEAMVSWMNCAREIDQLLQKRMAEIDTLWDDGNDR
jgi:hypothetical protein